MNKCIVASHDPKTKLITVGMADKRLNLPKYQKVWVDNGWLYGLLNGKKINIISYGTHPHEIVEHEKYKIVLKPLK